MSTSYLGINMSGKNHNVVDSNGTNIGILAHKERFTYSFEIKKINGSNYKKIWFLKPNNGGYGEGWLLDSAPIKNWDEYMFPNGWMGSYFKIDRATGIYDSYGNKVATANAGDICCLQNRCQTGNINKHLGLLLHCNTPSTSSSYRYRGYFIDTGVARNSSNTAVYGNWN